MAGFWIGCSVNHAGLTDGGGPSGDGAPGTAGSGGAGAAGHGGAPGTGGGAGGVVSGSGGAGATGGGATGTAGVGGKGGAAGSNGGAGPGGAGGDVAGTGGEAGSAVTGAAGNAGSSGGSDPSGAGGAAGAIGTAGDGGGAGSGGTSGSAGTAGTGGRGGGPAGRGGNGGRGGNAGRGGSAGTGGNPCGMYPSAKAFVTPTDGLVHCYWARSTSQTWTQAQQACMLQNGHLVTILSAEENDFVVGIAQFSSAFDDSWIGATDDKAGGDRTGPGKYRWVTNETWGYTNWAQGQPDGFCDPCSLGQTCTCDHRAVLSGDGTWNDRWQDNARSSVCEAP